MLLTENALCDRCPLQGASESLQPLIEKKGCVSPHRTVVGTIFCVCIHVMHNIQVDLSAVTWNWAPTFLGHCQSFESPFLMEAVT